MQKITNTQKKSLSKYSRHLCDLRTLTSELTAALDFEDKEERNLLSMKPKLDILTESFGHASIVLEQFSTLLKSIPENTLGADYEPQLDNALTDSLMVRCYKNTEEWRKLNDKVKSLITTVNKQKTALHKLRSSLPNVLGKSSNLPIVSQQHFGVIQEARDELDSVQVDIRVEILSVYYGTYKPKPIYGEKQTNNPVLESLKRLVRYLEEMYEQLDGLDEPHDVEMEEDPVSKKTELVSQTEDAIATMLLIIQSVYKKHLPENKSDDNDVLEALDELIDGKQEAETSDSESKEILEDNHLKEHLQDRLSLDTRTLQLDALNQKVQSLLANYVQYIATHTDVEDVKNVVSRVIPILEQTVLFVQYFITQKVAVHRVSCKMLSVLLKIFADLSTKGYVAVIFFN